MTRYWRDYAMYAAGAPFALVDWEYEVGSEEGADAGAIHGYVRAESCVRLSPPPSPWELETAARAGFFELPTFGVLRDVVRSLLGDASAELNLYALTPRHDRVLEAVAALQASEPPVHVGLLREDELLIGLVIGVDDGYQDVIVIRSASDIEAKLSTLTRAYDEAVQAYERDVDTIADVPEFLDRIAGMLHLGDVETVRAAR